ncbi:hypothetical protein CCHR01_04065 [Colletotrichum chrysophilum]|uniref:Uncharacterized protein n=1 Tax=Colletotrichum chrysophilum TaxID=1836956 RepID=A0AAD9ATQ9_9PEZI|nr:hypothetical protein CCHR01_04065 [Colletotrichum chrysophilum]
MLQNPPPPSCDAEGGGGVAGATAADASVRSSDSAIALDADTANVRTLLPIRSSPTDDVLDEWFGPASGQQTRETRVRPRLSVQQAVVCSTRENLPMNISLIGKHITPLLAFVTGLRRGLAGVKSSSKAPIRSSLRAANFTIIMLQSTSSLNALAKLAHP